MVKVFQKSLIVFVLVSTTLNALADRGIGKKNKSRVALNITTVSTLRSSISYNLKNGLTYKGSVSGLIGTPSSISNTIVTYQKGNTTYIIPYRQKMVLPEAKQGYVGMKLILRPH